MTVQVPKDARAEGRKGRRTQGPKDARAERRGCRTTRVPNDAGAERRGCRTTRVPNDAGAETARLQNDATRRDCVSPTFAACPPFPLFGSRALWQPRFMAAAPYGSRALWQPRLMAAAPYGSRALWQSRRSAVAPLTPSSSDPTPHHPSDRRAAALSRQIDCASPIYPSPPRAPPRVAP